VPLNSGPTLRSIFTHPIKACGALNHTQIELDSFGLIGDRRWMIVDSEGVFLSQREQPVLARIRPAFEGNGLRLSAPGMPEIHVTAEPVIRAVRKVVVWDDTCDAWDEGDDVAQWFSDYLHVSVRLVRMAATFARQVDTRYTREGAQTTFTDGFPVLIVSEASLDALNRRLTARGCDPVPVTRFRPNLVIGGCDAFAEDTWHTVQIGSVTLDVVKPCARCVVTTVDQATGTVPDVAEPLATLNTFRKQGSKVMFAQNAIHRAPGRLSVGNEVVSLA